MELLIDTDTASDDAVALMMALRSPAAVVRGITTVAGNVGVKQATQNALYVTELCDAEVPVFVGAGAPLVREAADATWFHGKDGLGDMGYRPARRKAEATHAVDATVQIVRDRPGMVLVTLGPLTNLAMALVREPAIVRNISRCVVMGGNPSCVGNVTPAAEYNIWCDPEAAEIVMKSGLPVELVGWQLSRGDAAFSAADIARARGMGTERARFAIDSNRVAAQAFEQQTGQPGIGLPDPTAMAVALDPALATKVGEHRVAVEYRSELTRGMTVVDELNVAGDERNRGLWSEMGRSRSKVKVVWALDIAGFKERVFAVLA